MRQRSREWPLLALATALALAFPLAASAQDDDDDGDGADGLYSQSGVYLTVLGVGAPWTDGSELEDRAEDRLEGQTGLMVESDMATNAWGLNARMGYRLSPRIGLEGQFEWLNNSDRKNDLSDGSSADDRIRIYTVTGNAKYYLATERIQPYLIGGAGWGRSRIKQGGGAGTRRNNGFSARFGGGVDLYGNEDVALSLETSYVWNTGGVQDLSYVSIGAGLTLRFYSYD